MNELQKTQILRNLSGIICPFCEENTLDISNNAKSKMYVGAVSLKDQSPALYCMACKTRIKITLKVVDYNIE